MNLKEYYKQLLSEELKKVTPEEAARIRAEKQGKPFEAPIRASGAGGRVWVTSKEYQDQKQKSSREQNIRRSKAAAAALIKQKEQGKVEHPGIADLKQIWGELGSPRVSGAPIIGGRGGRKNTGISLKDESSEGWVDQPRQEYGNIHWGGMGQAIREMHARGEIPEHKLAAARRGIMQNHLLYYTGFAEDDHKKYYIKSRYDGRNFGENKSASDLGISVTSNNRVNRNEYEPLISGYDPLHKDFEQNASNIRRIVRQNMKEVQTREQFN